MAGVKALRRIQGGKETTGSSGTAVASTFLLRYTGTIEDQREIVFPAEDIGLLSGTDRQYSPKYLAAIAMEGEATFEQLPYFFEAGVSTSAPTTDTGSGYIYTYTLPTTAQQLPRTYTLEGGDDNEAEEMEYSFVKDLTLSGNAGEAWMLSANWIGRQVSTSTFTPSSDAATPTVEEALFSKTLLYIDEPGGTIGTTLKSNTLLSAELKLVTGFQEVFAADGQLYFSFVKQVAPEVTLSITFEHDGTASAEKAKWRAGTARLIRLNCLGTALASAGAHTYKTMRANLAGKWEKFEKIDEQNGNDIIKATFRARYNSTAALFGSFVVVSDLVSLP